MISRDVHKEKNNIIYKILIIVISFFILINFVVFKFSILDLVKYFGFNLFYVILPGYLILTLLKADTINTLPEKIVYSFVIGIILTILSYFICYLTNLRFILYILGPLLSAAFLLLLAKDAKIINNLRILDKIDYQLIFIIFFLLMISFTGVSLRNLSPDYTGISVIYQDLLWNIGNADSLIKSFPVYDLRFSGLEFKYHYFAFVFRAVASLVTGISSGNLFFVYSQFMMIPFLVTSLYILAQTIFNNDFQSRFFVWTFLFTGCASIIYKLKNIVGLFLNETIAALVIYPNGIDLGIPVLLLLINILIKIYRNSKLNTNDVIISGILTALLTGAKAPLGIMVVGTIVIIFFINLIKKDNYVILNFKLMISMLSAFMVIYLLIIYGGGGNSIRLIPGATVLNTIFGKVIRKVLNILKLENLGYLQCILTNLSVPLHFLSFMPFAAVPFISWLIYKFKNFNIIKQEELLIGGLAVCGILGFYLFIVDGNSQLYFIFGATAFIEICALKWLFDNYYNLHKYVKRIIIATFIIASISSFSMFLRTSLDGLIVAYSAVKGMNKEAEPKINAITSYEYEGMIWLKNNVKNNEVIAVDRHYNSNPKEGQIPSPNDNGRYFYYSAYSGKQIFLEGWAYTPRTDEIRKKILERVKVNEDLYSLINVNRVNLMKENDIRYIVVSRFVNPDLEFNDAQLIKVFKNRDITIYKLME